MSQSKYNALKLIESEPIQGILKILNLLKQAHTYRVVHSQSFPASVLCRTSDSPGLPVSCYSGRSVP